MGIIAIAANLYLDRMHLNLNPSSGPGLGTDPFITHFVPITFGLNGATSNAIAGCISTQSVTLSGPIYTYAAIRVTSNTLAAGGYRTVMFLDAQGPQSTYGSDVIKVRFYQNGNVTVLINATESAVLSSWSLNVLTTWEMKISISGGTATVELYKNGALQGSHSAATGLTAVRRFGVGQAGDGSGTGTLNMTVPSPIVLSDDSGSFPATGRPSIWLDAVRITGIRPTAMFPQVAATSATPGSSIALLKFPTVPPASAPVYVTVFDSPYTNFSRSHRYLWEPMEGYEISMYDKPIALSIINQRSTTTGTMNVSYAFGSQSEQAFSYSVASGTMVAITFTSRMTLPSTMTFLSSLKADNFIPAGGIDPLDSYIGGLVVSVPKRVFQAKVTLIDDDVASVDRYVATFFADGKGLVARSDGADGVSDVKLKVIKASDGSTLVAESAMTKIATGIYKLDVTGTSRISDGAGYIAILTATTEGDAMTWYQPVGRDS
jgi:hypothetical protein